MDDHYRNLFTDNKKWMHKTISKASRIFHKGAKIKPDVSNCQTIYLFENFKILSFVDKKNFQLYGVEVIKCGKSKSMLLHCNCIVSYKLVSF